MTLVVDAAPATQPSVSGAESAAPPQRRKRVAAVAGFVGKVVGWLLILALLAVLTLAVLIPRVAGATPFTVLTGSMEPGLPPGTLIVAQPTDAGDIRIGQVVTFQIESGEPEVVTHRVVAVRQAQDGQPEFLTKGDANDVVDEGWRPAESVRGVLWYSVPHLGRMNNVLNGDQRQLAVYVVAGALALYALSLFAGDARDRHRRRRESRPLHHSRA